MTFSPEVARKRLSSLRRTSTGTANRLDTWRRRYTTHYRRSPCHERLRGGRVENGTRTRRERNNPRPAPYWEASQRASVGVR